MSRVRIKRRPMFLMVVKFEGQNIDTVEKSRQICPTRPNTTNEGYLPRTPVLYAIKKNYYGTAGSNTEPAACL